MTIPIVLVEVVTNFIVPELLEYIKRRYEETGTWPSVSELKARISSKSRAIIKEADDILAKIERDTNAKG